MTQLRVVTLLIPVLLPVQQLGAQNFETTTIAEGVYQFRHQSHNGLFVVTPEGVVAFERHCWRSCTVTIMPITPPERTSCGSAWVGAPRSSRIGSPSTGYAARTIPISPSQISRSVIAWPSTSGERRSSCTTWAEATATT